MDLSFEGWFANPPESDLEWDAFLAERHTKDPKVFNKDALDSSGYRIARKLAWGVLFGFMPNSWTCDVCRYDNNCSERTSSFCRIKKSPTFFGEEYRRTNYYIVWRNYHSILAKHSPLVIGIVGEHRYLSFMEFLTVNAEKGFARYTNREIKEKGYYKPEIVHSTLVSLKDIEEDPWQNYINNKIKKGDPGCLQYCADLDWLGL